MTDIFSRRARVTIGQPGELGRAWTGGGAGTLKIAFNVVKSSTAEENAGQVDLTNLSPNSRRAITKGQTVILEAGYETSGLELLCKGDIIKVENRHQGTEWITSIHVQDGRRALRKRLNLSFAPGASVQQVVGKIISEMKKEGAAVGFLEGLATQGADFVSGFTLAGEAGAGLQRALRGDLEVSMQDGALQIVKAGGATNDPIVLLSASTGLVGSVEVIGSKEAKEEGVRVTAKLQPRIAPGRRFQTEANINGVFVARKVTHHGDTHGDPWDTTIEAR